MANPWLVIPRPNHGASLRLFCFPYAGGSALIYHQWPDRLPANVELCAVQLPGRGSRLSESPYRELAPLVRAIADNLQPYLDKPFAMFGHSMGAVISYELIRLIQQEYGKEPLCLFVSGRRAPQLPNTTQPTYELPEPDFIEMLRRLNGTPKEVLANAEMMGLMIPLLRADFQLIQNYQYKAGPPLNCPITAFGGMLDYDATQEQIEAWGEQTRGRFSARTLPGGHFFIHTDQKLFLRLMAEELCRLIK